ncbi:MAG: dienelactone hydrolase family protein [Prolixibacteraceae bacterium]
MNKLFTLLIIFSTVFALNAQDYAQKQLSESPRHHEWIQLDCGDRELNCFVAYPETSEKSKVILVVHDNFGLTDWVRSFADQLAAKGYIAITPDLLSDFNSEIRGTMDFDSPDQAKRGIYALTDEQVKNDLNVALAFAENIPSGNGQTVVAGFGWGGAQTFRMATYNDEMEAALVFYGSTPEKEKIPRISVPVYAFYAGEDLRVTTQIPKTEDWMKEAGNKYDYVVHPGANHAYMKRGDAPECSKENKEAYKESWDRLLQILEKI